jgi:tryptophanyl-tRNA synthetase
MMKIPPPPLRRYGAAKSLALKKLLAAMKNSKSLALTRALADRPRPILFSGMQPSGRLHIGNYLGALKNWVELQNSGDYDCRFSIVDLHAITEDYEPKEKPGQILDLAANYIAAGVDPKRSVLFLQSLVPAHSELTWILNTITPIGELDRMTQYKDKSRKQQENINTGLFDYPVLMAADIILYDAHFVPVGDDQDQHLELARSLVRKFNAKFGNTFIEPRALHTPTPRVMSLDDPTKKMSKSHPAGCIFLDDEPQEIEKKLKRAVTDSETQIRHDEEKKPAISNLLEIYSGLGGTPIREIEKNFRGKGYGEFKESLTHLIADHFSDFRKKKASLIAKPATLKTILKKGSDSANKIADKKMAEVRKKIGLAI